MRKLIVTIISVFTLFSFFIISPEPVIANGTTIYVDDDGGADFTNIMDAINAANENDTIYVYSGIYNENLVIGKSIKLNGAGIGSVTIVGDGAHTIKINKNNVQISNFSIINTGDTFVCILLNYVAECIIDNNILKYGENGVYILGSDDNTIKDNIIEENNIGIKITNSDGNIIKRNNIQNNVMNGVYALSTSTGNTIYLNDFADNHDSNGRDEGSNFWDYNSQGNYWDDYTGEDSNGDGKGDIPYIINENKGNKDNYPLGDFITQKPEAIIDYISPNPASQGTLVSFNGHATSTVINYEWRSSINGLLSNSRNYQTSSLSVGTHTISYRVMGSDEIWSDYDYKTLVIIAPNQKPTANIIEPSTSIIKYYGEAITFLGDWSDDGQVIKYFWRSSIDGYLSDAIQFTKKNLSVGQHKIYLKVKDDDGEWSLEKSIDVIILSNSSNNPPVAFSGGPYTGFVNQNVIFDASESYDPDTGDSIISYQWDFGDGITGEGETIEHKYSSEGNYTVKLTVIDGNGGNQTATTFVNINAETNGENGKNDKDTPGFEVIIIIISVALIFFYKKRR